jgi:hypothetical protein
MGDIMHCDEHSGLMAKLDAIQSDTGRIPALAGKVIEIDKKLGEHLAEHRGQEKATGKAMAQSGNQASWWKTRLAGIAILVTLILALLAAAFSMAKSMSAGQQPVPAAKADSGLRAKGS